MFVVEWLTANEFVDESLVTVDINAESRATLSDVSNTNTANNTNSNTTTSVTGKTQPFDG
jgi:hypothetical protein